MLNTVSFFNKIRNTIIVFCIIFSLTGIVSTVSAGQDIWWIDTHQAPWNATSEEGFTKAVYFQFDGHRWVRSDAKSFYQTQSPDIPLVVFSPGYTSTTSDTVEVGMSLVRLYRSNQNCRTVFWNWPAEKIRVRLVRDIRDKIAVTATSGRYMTKFLQQLKPKSQVCMIGFSFGNRIICDAVERLGDDRPEGMRIHLVLTASATDQGWLASGSRHGNVPRLAEKILILYNPVDRALTFYPLLYGDGSCPIALGRFGPPMTKIMPEYRNRIEAANVQPYVGRHHRTLYHLQTPIFRQKMNDYLFFDESSDN